MKSHPTGSLAIVLFGAIAPLTTPAAAQLFGPIQQHYAGTDATAAVAGDLNGDGRVDIAAAIYGEARVAVLLNAGEDEFVWNLYQTGGSGNEAIAMGDLNGDGYPDLAVVRGSGDQLCVLLNNGAGEFPSRDDYATRDNPKDVAFADVDGDRDLDVLIANAGDDTVTFCRNNGHGELTFVGHYAVGDTPLALAGADLNRDGLPEIITANFYSQNISVLMNLGGGMFDRDDVTYEIGGLGRDIAVADMNGDGWPDVVVAANAHVAVLLGVRNGAFAQYVAYNLGTEVDDIVVGDLNLDGHPDVAVAPGSLPQILMLSNDGQGVLSLEGGYDSGLPPDSVCAADLDGDSDPELIVPYANYVGLLENLSFGPPIVLEDPESLLLPVGGGEAQFTVAGSGGLLTPWFRWRRDGEPLADGGGVQGALTPTLTIQATDADVGLYDCVVSNPGGEVASNTAVLGVRPNPCPADTNGDGVINTIDLITYLNLWTAGCP